jgi:hypothetical protein
MCWENDWAGAGKAPQSLENAQERISMIHIGRSVKPQQPITRYDTSGTGAATEAQLVQDGGRIGFYP